MRNTATDYAHITDSDRALIERAHANGLPVYLTYKAAPVVAPNGVTLHYKVTRTKLIRSRKQVNAAARGGRVAPFDRRTIPPDAVYVPGAEKKQGFEESIDLRGEKLWGKA